MLFHAVTPSQDSVEQLRWNSAGGRVRIVVLNYAFGQNRIQLHFSDDGAVRDVETSIILEM
jgi:hypothetical protein